MKITKLEKKKRLYLLETDQDNQVYITEDTIVRFFLTRGKEISENELKEVIQFAQFSYGKNLALYYLSFKKRTKKEVETYLEKQDVDPLTIPEILHKLQEEKWIDDQDYVQQVLFQNALSGDKGPQALRQKLYQKGISKHIIDACFELEEFEEIAEKVAQKLHKKYLGKYSDRALKEKVKQGLLLKGFDYKNADKALEKLEWVQDEQEQETLLNKELDKAYRKYSRTDTDYSLEQKIIRFLLRKGFDYDKIKRALREYL
ncbi:recombination regulator RecX [Streptococcus suis]|uniref:Regulatory protein RecX n=1 Tax=Streptococcus suis TaxID=1307 RepID=A0A4T2GNA0_STRSU|nr:recombination regulator RecX [Streptococcus suis]MBM7269702.1 recombination regulator RecX [Streptococcus suis]TII00458.1 recombination regulator RecX [Streptococcus suis]